MQLHGLARVADATGEPFPLSRVPPAAAARGVPEFIPGIRGLRARALVLEGRDDEARVEVAAVVAAVRTISGPLGPATLAFLGATVALAEGDDLRWSYNMLKESGARFTPGASLDNLRGILALQLGLDPEAEQHFRAGVEICDRERCVLESGRCHLGLAEVAIRRGDRYAARAQLDAAAAAFEACGAHRYLAQVESRRAQLGDEPVPLRAYPDGLSDREVEVLRLIARGRSNQQIAEELVIAPATVARHVSNILNKTGLANRTEAAAYAMRHALLA
jgi:DNA-binding CsgD family transcriptional regulator